MATFIFFTIFAAALAFVGFLIRYKGKLKAFADFDLFNPGQKSHMEQSIDLDALAEFLGKRLFLMAGMLFFMGIFFALGWDWVAWIFALPLAAIPFVAIYQLNSSDRFLLRDKDRK